MKKIKQWLLLTVAVLAFVTSFAACDDDDDSSSSAPNYQALYDAAVLDAANAQASDIRSYLITVDKNNKSDSRLQWGADANPASATNDKILVCTFNRYPESYKDGSNIKLDYTGFSWVVSKPELCDKLLPYVDDTLTHFAMHLKSLLGMPLSSTNTHLTAFWVKPEDLMRPAYNPDITRQIIAADIVDGDLTAGGISEKSFTGMSEAKTDTDGTGAETFAAWFKANAQSSYETGRTKYPWTRLGYTYDWLNTDGEVYGLTEFLVKHNSTVKIEWTKTIAQFKRYVQGEE